MKQMISEHPAHIKRTEMKAMNSLGHKFDNLDEMGQFLKKV